MTIRQIPQVERADHSHCCLAKKNAHKTPFVFGLRRNSCLITVALLLLPKRKKQSFFAFFGAVRLFIFWQFIFHKHEYFYYLLGVNTI